MNHLILVFLFTTGQVQFTTFGAETAPITSLQDNESNRLAFDKWLHEQAAKEGAKVCAVVPSYSHKSALHQPLFDLLTQRGDALPGIWEQQDGIRHIFKMPNDAELSVEDAVKFCKLAARVAFKNTSGQ